MNKEQIDKLKRNMTAFGGLSKEEREFLKEHMSDVGVLASCGECVCFGDLSEFNYSAVYRLRKHFELPEKKERWFLHTESLTVHTFSTPECQTMAETEPGYIEITEDEREYLENKPEPVEGFEWVLKIPDKGEQHACKGKYDISRMNGIRWTLVKKDPFVEYDIQPAGHHWQVYIIHLLRAVFIDSLPGMVGFAGYKFKLSDGTETEWLEDCPCLIEDKPATPIKARFYVGGAE
jgi:hypothetical protein